MKDEYIYCAVNDCDINKGYSKCCLYCNNTRCPERCYKKENTFCHCLMTELKGFKEKENVAKK